ncbi:hypothetical protein IV54_GL001601 [Levilactobacillus paucivorans]|uniref:Flavodoxin-like fold domain-containing protein n=2 Tax=Levilactobacillus paucivorans TaxID=616990 RepID=A0A0R2LQR3_9LACO|nr:hypothetical protein IV54_GL001601 [Levilactobacillus paucivorans]
MVADYQQRLLAADHIVFMFPVWWEVMPAMTKGFHDKVYAKGELYQADTMKTKLTKQPRIDIVTTMSTPNWIYQLIFGPLGQAPLPGNVSQDPTPALQMAQLRSGGKEDPGPTGSDSP